jgi:hypothetical protein
MIKVKETTVWPQDWPNHVYFLSNSKKQCYGYVPEGTEKTVWFSQPYPFELGTRQFELLEKNLPDPS